VGNDTIDHRIIGEEGDDAHFSLASGTGHGINFSFPKASEWALTHWCSRVTAGNTQDMPAEGPLLIVCNHPGTYDALIIFSQVGRRDIRWISTEIPFLDNLPHTLDHVIFASRSNAHKRMAAMRRGIRHLQAGGTLLYIGSGQIDPAPAVYPNAAKNIEEWLGGIDFFFRHVPGLRAMPTIVSGVVSPKWARSAITWLRRKDVDKRRLAEFGQVIKQMLFPGRLMFTPYVSFAPPVTVETLRSGELLPRHFTLAGEGCPSPSAVCFL
jgi:hypothetical protein